MEAIVTIRNEQCGMKYKQAELRTNQTELLEMKKTYNLNGAVSLLYICIFFFIK